MVGDGNRGPHFSRARPGLANLTPAQEVTDSQTLHAPCGNHVAAAWLHRADFVNGFSRITWLTCNKGSARLVKS